MKIKLLVLISTLAFSGLTHAQSDARSGIVESTDPAKIADIERRAQALGAPAPGPSGTIMPGMHHEKPMHERMHGPKPGEKHEHMHEHKHGDMHGHKHRGKHGAKHGAKHGHDGHAKMDGKGPHGAKPAMPVDAPAKP